MRAGGVGNGSAPVRKRDKGDVVNVTFLVLLYAEK
jgi:hypothetical protein